MTSKSQSHGAGGPLLTMAAAALVLGCGGSKDGGAQRIDGGAPPALAILTPASPTYTNKAVTIQVSVTPPPPSGFQVDLIRNGVPFARLSDPFTFVWDTTYDPEGTYELRASTIEPAPPVVTEPLEVVVDRTPPIIVGRTPLDGSQNVAIRDEVKVAFSEPLLPDSVSSKALALTLDGMAVASAISLGSDDKTIVALIATEQQFSLPGTMSMTVATTITDLAGNALVPSAPVSWDLPLWLNLGSPTSGIGLLAVSPNGVPFVTTGSVPVKVQRHVEGTHWDSRYGSPEPTSLPFTSETVLAVDSHDVPYLAWVDVPDLDGFPVSIARWNGSSWDKPFARLQVNVGPTKGALAPLTLAIDSENRPLVNWREEDGNYIARWTGLSWQFPFGLTVGGYRMVLSRSDEPALLATQSSNSIPATLRWTGTGWLRVNLLSSTQDWLMGIKFDSNKRIVASTATGRLLRGDALEQFTPPLPDGGSALAFALDSHDAPIIASDAMALQVFRWTGSAWDKIGAPLTTNSHDTPRIAIDASDSIFVGWNEISGAHLYRTNR